MAKGFCAGISLRIEIPGRRPPRCGKWGMGFVQPKQARALPQRVSHHRYRRCVCRGSRAARTPSTQVWVDGGLSQAGERLGVTSRSPPGSPKTTKGRRQAAAAGPWGAWTEQTDSRSPAPPSGPGWRNGSRGGPMTTPFQRQYPHPGAQRWGRGRDAPYSLEQGIVGEILCVGSGPRRGGRVLAQTRHSPSISFFLSPSSGIRRIRLTPCS